MSGGSSHFFLSSWRAAARRGKERPGERLRIDLFIELDSDVVDPNTDVGTIKWCALALLNQHARQKFLQVTKYLLTKVKLPSHEQSTWHQKELLFKLKSQEMLFILKKVIWSWALGKWPCCREQASSPFQMKTSFIRRRFQLQLILCERDELLSTWYLWESYLKTKCTGEEGPDERRRQETRAAQDDTFCFVKNLTERSKNRTEQPEPGLVEDHN